MFKISLNSPDSDLAFLPSLPMPHGIVVEEPITTYFRRVSSSNHKKNFIVPSTVKRQRLLVQAKDANEPKKPRIRQKLAPSDASRKRTKPSHGKTRISTPNRGSSSAARTASHAFPLSPTPQLGSEHELLPLSPDIGSASKCIVTHLEVKSSSGIGQAADSHRSRQFKSVVDGRKQYDSIQTSPPTMPSRRMHSTFCKHVQPIPLTINGSELSPCLSSLPTPAAISRHIISSGCARWKPVLSKLANVDVSAQPDLSDSTSARFSQISTNWGNGMKRRRGDDDDDENPFDDASASEMLVLSSQTQEQPLQMLTDRFLVAPIFRLPPPKHRFSRNISDSDSDGFVQSSQSQHVLPHHISPRRKGADQLFDSIGSSLADNTTLEEIVPSSQSQAELELNVSLQVSHYLTHVKPVRAGQCESPSLRNDLPSGNSMSPVPIHDMISPTEGTADGLDFVSVDPATEDESEDESSIRRTPDTVAPGGEILEECMNSLPHTVQDFEVMFGESSGSLPGDFPLSLR